jgi:hypothetical protein
MEAPRPPRPTPKLDYIGYRIGNPYRVFSSHWWLHLLKSPKLLWWDLQDIYYRAKYGWAHGDNFDLCSYHVGMMIGQLTRFRNTTISWPGSDTSNLPEEERLLKDKEEQEAYIRDLDIIIDGYQAYWEILSDYGTEKWTPEEYAEKYKEWRAPREAKWEEGMRLFAKHLGSMWH